MSLNYINPNIVVDEFNFKEIMDSIANDISNLFNYNENLIQQNNYITIVNQIIYTVGSYLKIYMLFDYNKKDITVQIYNSNIQVIINIKFYIFKTFYTYQKSNWESFYTGLLKLNPIVYYSLDFAKRQELRISLVNGNFYMYDNVELILPLSKGIILKKNICTCENMNNCNLNYSYIITIYW